jgi:hypothetical protein
MSLGGYIFLMCVLNQAISSLKVTSRRAVAVTNASFEGSKRPQASYVSPECFVSSVLLGELQQLVSVVWLNVL